MQGLAAQGFNIAMPPETGAFALNRGDVYPTNSAPVFLADGDSLTVAMMAWGYPGYPDRRRPGSSPRPLINARAESAYTSAMWRDSMTRRRCVIPAMGFYEWDSKKTKYLFSQPDCGVLLLAGIYAESFDINDIPQRHFAILTRAAAEPVAAVHDRMPVIIPRASARAWFNGVFDMSCEAVADLRIASEAESKNTTSAGGCR